MFHMIDSLPSSFITWILHEFQCLPSPHLEHFEGVGPPELEGGVGEGVAGEDVLLGDSRRGGGGTTASKLTLSQARE